jgi:hypothetical protein
MTQTALFFFYSQQLLWTCYRSVMKKNRLPWLGSGIMRLGRAHWAGAAAIRPFGEIAATEM